MVEKSPQRTSQFVADKLDLGRPRGSACSGVRQKNAPKIAGGIYKKKFVKESHFGRILEAGRFKSARLLTFKVQRTNLNPFKVCQSAADFAADLFQWTVWSPIEKI